jgi:hypothetical protein
MTNNPTSHDDKLLKRESYIRRERHVAFSLAVGCILCAIAKALDVIPADGLYLLLGSGVLLLIYADSCNLRLRHIHSIKFYRGTAIPR